MGWSSPRTWVPGEVVTDVMLNAHVRDNFLALGGTTGTITMTSPHMISPVVDSGNLTITAGSIEMGAPNVELGTPAGGYFIVRSGGDLYLRSNSGGTTHIDQGPTTFAGNPVSGIGALTMSGVLSGVTSMSVSGDITAQRGNPTGYVFLGNAGHYIGYDGTQYVFNAGGLNIPSGGLTISGAATVGGLPIVVTSNGVRNKIASGLVSSGSVGNSTATPVSVSFGFTYGTAPDVQVSLTDASDRSSTNLWGICHYSVSTTGFTVEFLNRTGATNTCFANWSAVGGT